MRDPDSLRFVEEAARQLGPLLSEVVFVGGAIVPLLVTDPSIRTVRPTDDVDVVTELASRKTYHQLEERLRERGFRHDVTPGAPICRWRTRSGVRVDIMPTDPTILGFSNRWYPTAVRTARPVRLTEDLSIQLIAAPVFLASKLEAFHNRGKSDLYGSHDLEDALTVIDGRAEIVEELTVMEPDLRGFVQSNFATLLNDPNFLYVLPGHLEPSIATPERAKILEQRLRRLAGL